MEPDESQKPTLCEICDKTFASPSHLAVHERIHTNERPFSCETCGKTFTQKSALVRHVRIHTNEKPFECSKCDRRFNDNGNHKKHERTCNGTKSKSKAQKGITTKKGTIKSNQGAALAQQKPGKKEKKKLKKIKRLKRVPLTEGNDCPEIIDRLPGSALVTPALDAVPQVENQENNPSTQDLSLPPVSDSQKPPEETYSKADSLSQPQDSVTKGNNSIVTEDECALENSFSPPEKKSKMTNPENICMKCGESYPSKEAKRLHDCDSIMATMADDGHVRGTPGRNTTNTTLNPQEQSDAPPDKDSDPPDEIASNPKVVDQSEESDSKGDTSMEDEETMESPGSSPSSAEKTSLLTGVLDELTSNLSETPGVEAEDVEKLKEKQVFQCSTCNKRFNKRSALKRHVKTHSEDKPFSCSKCDYGCNDLSNLKKHEKTHKNKRPFKCRTCGKKFSLSHHLHVHERIHRNERSYKCEDCGKAFTQLGALNRHKFIHTGDKPFACEVCDYRSNDKGNLRKHERTHSSNATTTTHSKPTTSPNNPAKIQKLDPEEAEFEKLDRSGPEVKTEREPRLHRKSSFKALTLMQKYSAEEKLFENLSDEIVSENGEDGSKGIEYGPATYTVPKKKAKRCGECEGCRTPNCQVCSHCLDMPKYGGPGTKRQVCRERKCLRVYYNVFERDTKGVVDNKSGH